MVRLAINRVVAEASRVQDQRGFRTFGCSARATQWRAMRLRGGSAVSAQGQGSERGHGWGHGRLPAAANPHEYWLSTRLGSDD